MEDCPYRFKKSTEQSPAPSPKAGSADFLVNYRLERCQCSFHTLAVRSEKQLGILHAGCIILSFLRREIDQDRSLPGFARPRKGKYLLVVVEQLLIAALAQLFMFSADLRKPDSARAKIDAALLRFIFMPS